MALRALMIDVKGVNIDSTSNVPVRRDLPREKCSVDPTGLFLD